MPNLNYPSEVQAVGDSGSVEIVKSNKNILDFGYDSVAGITFNKNRVTIKNPNSYNYCENFNLKENKILSGKKVVFTYVFNGSVTGDNYVDLIFNSNKRSYIVQKQANKSHGTYTNEIFTKAITFANDEYLIGCCVWTAGTTCDLTINVQIEISDEETEFVEHEGNIYTIPVQKPFYKLKNVLDASDTIEDYFIFQNSKWYEYHNMAKVNLENINWYNGATQEGSSVNYKRWNSATKYSNNNKNLNSSNRYAASNYFRNRYYNIFSSDSLGFNIEASEICIRFPIAIADTSTAIKNYFQSLANEGNGAYVLYPAQEPELIECTEEQTQILEQIVKDGTYKGKTHFYTTEDLKPTIELTYYKDLETLFKNQANMQETLNNVQAQLLEID